MLLCLKQPMKLLYIILLVIVSQVTGISALALEQLPDSTEVSIDKIMTAYSGNNKPRAVIGIIRNGAFVFRKGYGMADLKSKKPNHPEVAYEIASVSKQFTAAAILSLIRQKKLAFTDDIRTYLPSFPKYDKEITVGNLLYHTSGIRDYMVLMWLTGKSFEDKFLNEDALEIIYRQSKLHFATGTRCVYSNSNYVLLAEILKKVSGNSLTEYAHTVLFKPLGMGNTGFDGFKVPAKTAKALSYYPNSAGYKDFRNDNRVAGDGGVLTTLNDLFKWDKTFYDKSSLASETLVKGKLVDGKPLTYGMGIMTGLYKGLPVQMHPGAFLGYRAELLRFPEQKISIICLANTEEINPEQLTRAIADVYIFKEAVKKQPSLPSPEEVKAVTGKYEVAPNVFVDISLENGVLIGQVTGQPKQMLSPMGSHSFKIVDSDDQAVFSLLAAGKMQQLTVIQKQGKTIAKRPALIETDQLSKYIGNYYSEEQKASYVFYLKKDGLYFRMGNGPEVSAEILRNNHRVYFSYKNLEQATIDFQVGADGAVAGFSVNSGRVSNLQFIRK
jgi:CubicO group peptidase (beta-lactamase class C family)